MDEVATSIYVVSGDFIKGAGPYINFKIIKKGLTFVGESGIRLLGRPSTDGL
jgi:hypothetical protein